MFFRIKFNRTASCAILSLAIVMMGVLLSSRFSQADEIVARELLISQGCKGCHAFEGSGGILGPPLDQAGSKFTRVQLWEKLLNPQATNPDSVMPDFKHLTDEQMNDLLDFLMQKKKK